MTMQRIDKIIRSERKTLALEITPDAQLVVRAPFLMSEDKILSYVSRKHAWIDTKKQYIQKKSYVLDKKRFVNGESFLFLGITYRLKLIDVGEIKLSDFLEFPKKYLPYAGEELVKWYRGQAKDKISQRIGLYAKKVGLNYTMVNITNAQKRWGSCNHKGILNFSWRLMTMPLRVIDYVVVHELVHILEKNHSKSFWDKVKIILPDYGKLKKLLREKGNLCRFDPF